MRFVVAAALSATLVPIVPLASAAGASPPRVSIVRPAQGQVVSGWVTLEVSLARAHVERVDYFVDRARVGSSGAPPSFRMRWNAGRAGSGRHTVYAVARDAAGHRFRSQSTAFTVSPASTTLASCARPYGGSSPWNTPIGTNPAVHADSRSYVSSINGPLTSDPTQYTYPVYYANATSQVYPVELSGRYSNVTGATTMSASSRVTVSVPIPATAAPAAGSDAQAIIVDPATGDEWGFWQLYRDGSGRWHATNGYHYNTRWNGVPPHGFGSRGAGVPYLAGLVRPCEIAQGHIDHALAFAYPSTSSSYVWPATKSDGGGGGNSLPEGARLQLDPSLGTAQLKALGITGPALVVARALQTYGMYLIDSSGRPKVMFEYESTAHWNGLITARTVSAIPVSDFRWVDAG